jgi:hypothetical protein
MKKQYAGHIFCKKLNKTVKISLDAIPCPVHGFLCDCGVWVNEFTYGHDLVWNKQLSYGRK